MWVENFDEIALSRTVSEINSNSNSNWTFIALNLPKQEDSKAQQNKKQSTKFCVQGHNRGSNTTENARRMIQARVDMLWCTGRF